MVLLAGVALSTSCSTSTAPAPPTAQSPPGRANPASVNCERQGGKLSIERRGDGGELGICLFEDNRQCEEWALLRGLCPAGGVEVTGYATPAARYCAISGGRYRATGELGTDKEQGACTFGNGSSCDAQAYFNGTCSPGDAASATIFSDPFAYCAAVGNVDGPDARYTGDPMPESVVAGLVQQGVVAPDAPPDAQRRAVWRCLDGQVMACHFGANLPCLEKADTSPTPSQAMTEFCASSPGSDSIPAAVTGRATVYAWGCQEGVPVPVGKPFSPDGQGFLSEIWHQLPRPEASSSLTRIKLNRDGRVASIPIDPDNVQALRDLIESGPMRSHSVELFLYEPVGLLPQLLVSGEPESVQRFVATARDLFLDTGVKHTVVISARLTQLTDSDIRSLGLNLFPSSVTYSGSASWDRGKEWTWSLDALLNQGGGNVLVADESLSKGKALVASEVFTPNGVKAEISDVQHEPVFSLDTYGNVQTEYQDLETTIEVTPMVVSFDAAAPAGSKVRLDITVKVSIISGEKRTGDVTAPQYSDKSFTTTRVFPADGRTYLVGSFVSDSDITSRSGVPYLSKIPLLKYLFSQKTTTRSRSYALLTLAVNVLPVASSWDEVRQSWSHGGDAPGSETSHGGDDLTAILDHATQPLGAGDWVKTP